MKKIDSVTGEEFECAGDESCWCMELPNVLPFSGGECIGPTRVEAVIGDKESDTKHGSSSADHGRGVEGEVSSCGD